MVPRKPGGGGCVCMSYRDARLDMPGRIAYMEHECETSPGPGVLAYLDGEPAGWCSVAPKSTYRRLLNSRTIPHLDEERDPWSIVCFVVRGGFRRRGLMHDLLDGAVEHARASGAALVEGYPVETGGERVDAISGYVGTVELFEKHGFTRLTATDAHSGGRVRWVVRRELG
jgi:GNAT superfamily N-acetyltransferase